jgi:hypothetical protein
MSICLWVKVMFESSLVYLTQKNNYNFFKKVIGKKKVNKNNFFLTSQNEIY